MSTGSNDQPKRYTISGASRISLGIAKKYFSQKLVPIQRIFDLADACLFQAACHTRPGVENTRIRIKQPSLPKCVLFVGVFVPPHT